MISSKNYLFLPLMMINMHIALYANEVSKEGKISGLIRTFYINKENKDPESKSQAVAIAGKIKYESVEWNGFKAGVAGYASDTIYYQNHAVENPIFKEAETKGFSYLGEGYIDYHTNDLLVRVGRQLIYTPLVVSSDIRRLPDTFEAATAIYSGIDHTSLFAGYVQRWTGYDSGGNISKFKRPRAESKGAEILGITYVGVENLSVQGWLYSLDKMANAMYAQSDYDVLFSDKTELIISAQVSHFIESLDTYQMPTGIDGTLYGVQTSLIAGAVTLTAGYNHVCNKEGKFVINGLGNGPYFTSREEWSLDGMEDGRAYFGSVDYNLAHIGMDALTLSGVYEVFTSAPANTKIEEREFLMTYAESDKWKAELSYVIINDRHNNAGNDGSDADYNRFMIRLGYFF